MRMTERTGRVALGAAAIAAMLAASIVAALSPPMEPVTEPAPEAAFAPPTERPAPRNPAPATAPPAQAPALEAQRARMRALDKLDGEWRGSAWTITPSGERVEMIQTERIGSMLDGAVKLIEGRGYGADDTLLFAALGVVSYDLRTSKYQLRAYSGGQQGDFDLTVTDDGFSWSVPAGPATIRYVAVVKDGRWEQHGERLLEGQEPFRFIEMRLERIGDSTWPAAGAVGPR